MKSRVRLLVALLVASHVILVPGTSWAAPPPGHGTLTLTVDAPSGSTALVEVDAVNTEQAPRTVVHEADRGTTHSIDLPVGAYRLTPRVVLSEGTRYVATAQPYQVTVKAGQVSTSTVSYAPSTGVQDLAVTDLSETAVSLAWTSTAGEDTTVWRVSGDEPTMRPGRGVEVPLQGTTAHDTGLAPGKTYSYSIFARPGDGAYGRSMDDPVTITVGTIPTDTTDGTATFVLSPGATILSSDEVARAVPVGDGVEVTLAPGVMTPVPGTTVILPVSETLQGGYLGQVATVSGDGRTLGLVMGSMTSAFDLYHLDVPDVDAVPAAASSAAGPSALQLPGAQEKARSARSGKKPGNGPSYGLAATTQDAPQTLAGPATGKVECGVEQNVEVSPDLGLSHAGHADIVIDKRKILFVEVPDGVKMDVGYSATLSGTIDVEAQTAVECGFPLPSYAKQVTAYPVPMALQAQPEVGVSISSKGKVENVGFAATAGFEARGSASLSGDHDFDGDIINTVTPTEPTGTSTLSLGVEVGGSAIFGPGVGTAKAGVVAGLQAELYVIDASVGVNVVEHNGQTSSCIELAGTSSFSVAIGVRAWIAGWDVDYLWPIEALSVDVDWPGSPWFWPDDCTNSDTPTDDVVGDGVTPVDEDLTGSSDQWGKVDGFVPGQKTWVLSTGRVQDAVGAPGFFASTGLGLPGDPQLSALSGFNTHDAAVFRVTVIPNEDTLHVRYAFASEEYPEYVGSSFNDAMAVFVDGQNCALVPGTQTPVSINTINAYTNSAYYVDNQAGAAGYGTTMDGLTKPLECTKAVTPGEPVTIRIAVADASDGIYDSAVALLDGGIWSD